MGERNSSPDHLGLGGSRNGLNEGAVVPGLALALDVGGPVAGQGVGVEDQAHGAAVATGLVPVDAEVEELAILKHT